MSSSRHRGASPVPTTGDGGSRPSTTTLTVWHYSSAMGASAGELRLRNLEERGALVVIDAITVVWMPATPEPRVGRLRSRGGAGARRGAVLGALAGALVLAPVAGAAAGASVGALAGRLRHTGIDEAFLREMEERLVPGTSALLVLSENLDLDAIRPFLERGRSRGDVTLMHALVDHRTPQALRELLDTVPGFPSSSDLAPEDVTAGDLPPASSVDPPPAPSRPRKESP
jgi:uncharacterized membrane protein